ncbi:solute carrier family member 5 [Stylonychia lemnae]|uniref:Solute carrier family member 5 n=1 Tax=Stylonychia lemnae TaxID=5949 RepID=A0A078AUP5_STYLE|nr:solute carrier family member 5 [Stylonychia lemnae]|eukprot:CDW84962.1 solute carrier family member 5 [Stylonychia lemnae]
MENSQEIDSCTIIEDFEQKKLLNDSIVHENYDTESELDSENKSKVIDVDKAFEKVGGFGRYQLYSLIFGVCLISNNCFLLYNISYFEQYPNFKCFNNETQAWNACTRQEACSLAKKDWQPDYSSQNSIHNWVEQLELYCNSESQIGFLGSLFFAGLLTSMFLVIPFSDKYGRKPLLYLNAFAGTIIQGAFLIANELSTFYFLMFLMGIVGAINPCVGYVYIMEIVMKKHQTISVTIAQVGEGLAAICGPLYFMYIGNRWEPMIYIGTIISLISSVMVLWIKESPRYLASKGQFLDAKAIILEIADFNKISIQSNDNFEIEEPTSAISSDKNIELILKSYIGYPSFVKNMIIMAILWTTVSFNFFLMNFYLSNIEGDINMNNLLQSLGMILSYGVSAPIINRMGVKPSFVIFFLLCCLSSILYITVPVKSAVFVSILVFIGRLGICPAYTLTFICSNMLFPAEIKSTLISICNIFARAITMGAPLN